jgi:two-component system cell cycle response regulator DivK
MEKQQLILVVEDNEDNRTVYTAILMHYHYAVLEAVNGQDGVRQATRHRPDLVLMDLSMPVMDGWDAIRRIRENEDTSDTPVIAVSAHDLQDQEWREAGFSGYLSKPCEPRRLVETVRDFLPPLPQDP